MTFNLPLNEQQKIIIQEEIDERFDPEFCDYYTVVLFVCELYGVLPENL